MAEMKNKAIFVFTAVTIIFLPLSFFTSNFRMNLQGIQSTNLTEDYFWKVCGSVSFSIILLTVLYAFRHRIYRKMSAYHLERQAFYA